MSDRICQRSRLPGIVSATAVILVFGWAYLLATAYPPEGRLTTWRQPNGVELKLRVFGDEYYARTATEEGYTVLFKPETGAYHYAIKAADGETLVAGDVPADQKPPAGLPKQLLESKEVVEAIRAKKIEESGIDHSKDWNARKKAVQAERARQRAAGKEPASKQETIPAKPAGPQEDKKP